MTQNGIMENAEKNTHTTLVSKKPSRRRIWVVLIGTLYSPAPHTKVITADHRNAIEQSASAYTTDVASGMSIKPASIISRSPMIRSTSGKLI